MTEVDTLEEMDIYDDYILPRYSVNQLADLQYQSYNELPSRVPRGRRLSFTIPNRASYWNGLAEYYYQVARSIGEEDGKLADISDEMVGLVEDGLESEDTFAFPIETSGYEVVFAIVVRDSYQEALVRDLLDEWDVEGNFYATHQYAPIEFLVGLYGEEAVDDYESLFNSPYLRTEGIVVSAPRPYVGPGPQAPIWDLGFHVEFDAAISAFESFAQKRVESTCVSEPCACKEIQS